MTETNESSDRLDRLERLMEQQIINTADLTQQIIKSGLMHSMIVWMIYRMTSKKVVERSIESI